MAEFNVLLLESSEINNIVIETDMEGHHNITPKKTLKYNRLVSNRDALCNSRKNVVVVDGKDVSNIIIEADLFGVNTVKSFDEYSREETHTNIFQDILMRTQKKKNVQSNLIDVYLTEKRESLQDKLRRASEFHKTSWFERAIELYENALDTIKYDSYPDEYMLNDSDMLAIKFALALSKIGLNTPTSLQCAEEILKSLIEKYGEQYPSLYYYLAKVYFDFHNYQKAKKVLRDGLKILEKLEFLIVINWPGMKENVAEETTKEILMQNMESLVDQCTVFRVPDAKCCFPQCQIEERKIYFKSPLFVGYTSLKCTNKCNITYHKICWKKKTKIEGIKKLNSALDEICITNDCFGLVCEITIYDEFCSAISSVASSYKDEKKSSKNDCKKSKSDQNTKKGDKLDIKTEKDCNIPKNVISDDQDLTSGHLGQIIDNKISLNDMFQRRHFTFNLNAKEYVPSTRKPLAICDQPTQSENINKITPLNTNAKEYIPMAAQKSAVSATNYAHKYSQCTGNFVSQSDYDALKREIGILQKELFKTEETSNSVLAKYEELRVSQQKKIKKTRNASTETDVLICNDCKKLKSVLEDKDAEIAEISALNERQGQQIKTLEKEIEELKSLRILDRQIFSHHEQKFLDSNKVLVGKIQELTAENDLLRKGFEDYKERNQGGGILRLREILMEQINHMKNFYLHHVIMFENKCRHMIWELQDIKSITTQDSVPSVLEVENNLLMWRQCLQATSQDHVVIMAQFEKITKRFTVDPLEEICASAVPSLVPEPPSIILSHFKSIFLANKRLQQDLNRQMANYYKLISLQVPGICNYAIPQSPPLLTFPDAGYARGNTAELTKLNPPPGLVDLGLNTTDQNLQEGLGEACANLDGLMRNYPSLDNAFSPQIQGNVSERGECSLQLVESSETVKDEPKRPQKYTDTCSTPLPQKPVEKEPKTVVGPDGLMYRLQQKCPLIAPRILQEAVQLVREKHGGLSGLDSKTLMQELKTVIADLCKKERQKPGYQKVNIREKPSPWAQINPGNTWHNTNPRGNCTVCFERMNSENSTYLRCQHVFHTVCIKTWLQTDSICPICRSYTTLDDEFPPLNSK